MGSAIQTTTTISAGLHPDEVEELVSALQVPALRVAYGITRDRHLAEDVVADTFVKLYRHRHRLDTSSPIEPWVMRVVVNSSISAVRRRSSLRRALTRLRAELGHAKDPEEVALQNLEAAALRALMVQASAQDRALLVLRYYLDLGPSEIADRLGWPEGTVKTRLHRARARMKLALEAQGGAHRGL